MSRLLSRMRRRVQLGREMHDRGNESSDERRYEGGDLWRFYGFHVQSNDSRVVPAVGVHRQRDQMDTANFMSGNDAGWFEF